MTLKQDIISVLLPVYNAGKYLPACLESLQKQSYHHIEIIAIDDHSRDNSFKILQDFKKKCNDLHILLSRNKKRYGLAICYNRALKQAKGKFIAFMNPCDLNAIHRFKRQVNFLSNHPRTVAVGTQYTIIDKDNRKLDRSDLPEEHEEIYQTLLPSSTLHPETVMINRELLPKDLLYFKHNKYPFVFTEVFVKFFQYGTVANLAHSLYYHRAGVKRNGRRISKVKHLTSIIKIWLNSRANYDYRPKFRSIFAPMVKGA